MAKTENVCRLLGPAGLHPHPAFSREFGAAIGVAPSNPTAGPRVAVNGLRAEMNNRCCSLRILKHISDDLGLDSPDFHRGAARKRTIDDHIAVAQQTCCICRVCDPSMAARDALPAQKGRAAAISADCNQLNVLTRREQKAEFCPNLA